MDLLESKDCSQENDNDSLESGAIIVSNNAKPEYVTTSKKDCLGFYLYGSGGFAYWGAVHVYCLPYLVEAIAALNGVSSDRLTKCDISKIDYKCEYNLYIFGVSVYLDTKSIQLFLNSFCVFLQAVLIASIGPIGRFGNLKKILLAVFGLFGSISTLFFGFVNQENYWLTLLLAVIGAVCYGVSLAFHFPYLSTLIDNSNQVMTSKSLLKSKILTYDQYFEIREKVANKISSREIAINYFGFMIILAVLNFINKKDSFVRNLHYACAVAGVWWLVFTLLSLKFLNNRNEASFPKGQNFITYSWKVLYKSFKLFMTHFDAFMLLVSWIMFSCALLTVGSISYLLTKSEVTSNQDKILRITLLAPLSSIPGTFGLNFLQNVFKFSTKKMLIICNIYYILLCLYMCIGFFTKQIGYHRETEAYIVSVLYGSFLGATKSFYRVQYNELIPNEKEHEFYTLYIIASYGSSWSGPLLVALIYSFTNNIRYGIILLMLLFTISLIFVLIMNNSRKRVYYKRQYLN